MEQHACRSQVEHKLPELTDRQRKIDETVAKALRQLGLGQGR